MSQRVWDRIGFVFFLLMAIFILIADYGKNDTTLVYGLSNFTNPVVFVGLGMFVQKLWKIY